MRTSAPWLIVLVAATAPALAQQSTALRMQRVVTRYTAETGNQVLGMGSWMSGRNYGDVLAGASHVSDHDMRLLMPRGTRPGPARAAWQQARRRMVALIQEEFGDDAGRVLAQTNLYPPSQLMAGVEDTADAMLRFRQMNQVPNLGHTGRVTIRTNPALAEGLYGPGADAYTQSYERAAGRVFYRRGDRVFQGLSDLTHMSEGTARYTIRGTANTAVQWTCKATEAIAENDPQALVKYLDRFSRDVTKCRSLARLTKDTALSNQLRTMATRIQRDPSVLRTSRGAVRQLIQRAQLHAALLRQLEHPNPIRRGIARLTLDAVEAKNALGTKLTKLSEKVPPDIAIRGIFFAIGLGFTSRSLGENDMLGAYEHGVSTAGSLVAGGTTAAEFMASVSPAVMLLITRAVLENARKGGYEWVAGRQSAFDLLDGIFTTTGVDHRRYSVDDLVRHCRTEEALAAFVLARAHQAADRGFGPKGRLHDVQTADAIFRKCYPVILYAWHAARARLMGELWHIMDEIERNTVVLFYAPNPAALTGKTTTVTVRAEPTDPDEGAKLRRSRELLRILLGVNKAAYAVTSSKWTPAGRATDPHKPVRVYRLPAGNHAIALEQTISIGEASLPFRSSLRRDIRRRAMVMIPVAQTRPVVRPEPPRPPGKPWRPPFPTITQPRLGAGWTVEGPYSGGAYACGWNCNRAFGKHGTTVRVDCFYVDHPDGAGTYTWRWDKQQRKIVGRPGKAQQPRRIRLPYGDDAWLAWEESGADGNGVIYVVRWGELLVNIGNQGLSKELSLAQVRSAVRHVLDDIGRQLEARRPKK